MLKTKIVQLSLVFAVALAAFIPNAAQSATHIRSVAAVVTDTQTGKVLYSKNADTIRVPASLTKLVAALVVFDEQPNLTKPIAVGKTDEVGGGRLAVKKNATYYCKDLIAAALIVSANNAANAMVRCTDLSRDEFIAKMNQKARELGTLHSVFYEPSGMNPKNRTTAGEYVRILNAAVANPNINYWLKVKKHTFAAANNKKIRHTLSNTNLLLKDGEVSVLGGKTGFLYESRYNLANVFTNPIGKEVSVVVLGSPNRSTSFAEAKKLGMQAMLESMFLSQR